MIFMKTQSVNNTKVGIFVLAGFFALMLALYMIGSNRSVFGSNFELKVHFTQLNGLSEGNNVLFSGIQAGTVKSINMLNDTTIEVVLIIDNKVKSHIHKNALAAIGSEGLMGNKVINISNVPGDDSKVNNGDLLAVKKTVNLDAMILKLAKTNDNVEVISEILRKSILKVDSSSLLNVLIDHDLGQSIKATLSNAESASANASEMTHSLNLVAGKIRDGKGTAGMLLTDTAFANNLKTTLYHAKTASANADKATAHVNDMVSSLATEISSGKGTLHVLLKDSVMAANMQISMENIKKGTADFDENMEALKHNFLLRGFFAKKEKQKQDSIKSARKITSIN